MIGYKGSCPRNLLILQKLIIQPLGRNVWFSSGFEGLHFPQKSTGHMCESYCTHARDRSKYQRFTLVLDTFDEGAQFYVRQREFYVRQRCSGFYVRHPWISFDFTRFSLLPPRCLQKSKDPKQDT